MNESVAGSAGSLILYDSSLMVPAPHICWLQPRWWTSQSAVKAEMRGRGSAIVVQSPVGLAVLRRFRRGGWVAPLLHDRYWRWSAERSRGFQEFRLLGRLRAMGLPVPRPLAASFEPAGPFYRAGLLTRFVPETRPLADIADELTAVEWRALASVLQRFFHAGLVHPDLNARNLLLDNQGQWFMLDFDRAYLRGRPSAGRQMIQRLARSLRKHAGPAGLAGFDQHLRDLV